MRRAALLLGPLAVATLLISAARPPLLANAGLEAGLDGWTIDDAMTSRSNEQAAEGAWSLKIVDGADNAGSNALGPPVTVAGAGVWRLRGQVNPVSGEGLGVYVRVLGADGRELVPGNTFQITAPAQPAGRWSPFQFSLYTGPGARTLQLWIHSYNASRVTAYLDDFELVELPMADPAPPLWTPEYKLRPDETARLTPADVVGPDGIVYPNWTRVGVPGGIPTVPVVARVDEHGGRAGDGLDDAAALEAAIAAAAQRGGGAVEFGPGEYHLSKRIAIKHDGIVLRGAGRDRTRIVFNYAIGPAGLRWAEPDGDVLMNGTSVTVNAVPTGLRAIEILADGQRVALYEPSTHSGNSFSATARGYTILERLPTATSVTLRAVARWADGAERSIERVLRVDRAGSDPADTRRSAYDAAISFCGEGAEWKSKPLKLAADGRRGAMSLRLESTEGLAAGDAIWIDGPATERWKRLTRNQCPWGNYRQYAVLISAVEGNTVHLEQPLRIEFPAIDGSRVWKIDPIRRCGIEDLTIEQTENLWITTVALSYAWECWARGVKVVKMGRFPIYGAGAKWCTIVDCVFDDAWFKGGGGTAYVGWERSFDNLMDRCESTNVRHGPCVQWAASGNVIRRSRFARSDAQWHSGWTNENLFEQCEVDAATGNGSYGYGGWASPPEDTAHGPNGPRNVIYNCDFSSPRAGLWMGGMNENWLILHNRFRAASGPGVFLKKQSFDHLIRGNVFALADPAAPAVVLETPDCSGVEIEGNRLYGGAGTIAAGASRPAVEGDNQVLPYQADPPRPQPVVASIYEWQQANVKPVPVRR